MHAINCEVFVLPLFYVDFRCNFSIFFLPCVFPLIKKLQNKSLYWSLSSVSYEVSLLFSQMWTSAQKALRSAVRTASATTSRDLSAANVWTVFGSPAMDGRASVRACVLEMCTRVTKLLLNSVWACCLFPVQRRSVPWITVREERTTATLPNAPDAATRETRPTSAPVCRASLETDGRVRVMLQSLLSVKYTSAYNFNG